MQMIPLAQIIHVNKSPQISEKKLRKPGAGLLFCLFPTFLNPKSKMFNEFIWFNIKPVIFFLRNFFFIFLRKYLRT